MVTSQLTRYPFPVCLTRCAIGGMSLYGFADGFLSFVSEFPKCTAVSLLMAVFCCAIGRMYRAVDRG